MMLIRRGRIAYVSDKPEDRGRRRGYDLFTVSRGDDGTLIQRALSVIEDAPHVVRDVVQTCDANLRPRDAFVRIQTGKTAPYAGGSAWFRFGDDAVTCEGENTADGRFSLRHELRDGPVSFCNHSIVGDAWMMAPYPVAQGAGDFVVHNFMLPTLNKQGATGPTLASATHVLRFLGRERITVPAGTFDCLHFRTSSGPVGTDFSEAKFAYDMWCTDDGLYTAVLSGYLGERRYELVELNDGTP